MNIPATWLISIEESRRAFASRDISLSRARADPWLGVPGHKPGTRAGNRKLRDRSRRWLPTHPRTKPPPVRHLHSRQRSRLRQDPAILRLTCGNRARRPARGARVRPLQAHGCWNRDLLCPLHWSARWPGPRDASSRQRPRRRLPRSATAVSCCRALGAALRHRDLGEVQTQ
jgi:hypothetical protein